MGGVLRGLENVGGWHLSPGWGEGDVDFHASEPHIETGWRSNVPKPVSG